MIAPIIFWCLYTVSSISAYSGTQSCFNDLLKCKQPEYNAIGMYIFATISAYSGTQSCFNDLLKCKQPEYNAIGMYIFGEVKFASTQWPSMTSTSPIKQVVLNDLCESKFQQTIGTTDSKSLNLFLYKKPQSAKCCPWIIKWKLSSAPIVCHFKQKCVLKACGTLKEQTGKRSTASQNNIPWTPLLE